MLQRPVAGGNVQAGVLKSSIPGSLQHYPYGLVDVLSDFNMKTGSIDKPSIAYFTVGGLMCLFGVIYGIRAGKRLLSKKRNQVEI